MISLFGWKLLDGMCSLFVNGMFFFQRFNNSKKFYQMSDIDKI